MNEFGLNYKVGFDVKTGADEANELLKQYNAMWQQMVESNPIKIKISSDNNGFENVQKITVLDATGKVVQTIDISERPDAIYSFDLGGKTAGYYLIRITGDNISEQLKVELTK